MVDDEVINEAEILVDADVQEENIAIIQGKSYVLQLIFLLYKLINRFCFISDRIIYDSCEIIYDSCRIIYDSNENHYISHMILCNVNNYIFTCDSSRIIYDF